MKKKLTHRQQQFLRQFLDISQEMKQPVHYVTVAERMGIGNVTAYEMLHLLEERGLVQAEYQTSPDQHGPGRASVLFFPTRDARRMAGLLSSDSIDMEDWQTIKEHILQQLREGNARDYEELLSNLLERIPKRNSALIFVTELITAVVLILAKSQESPEIRTLMEHLKRVGLPQEISLGVLSGIAMLLSALERSNRHFSTILQAQVSRYEEVLSQLSEETRRQLSEFTREAVLILAS
ncbi:MAG: hypothetical protein ABFD29_09700 [Anaerolineaceae bacterium]